MKKALVIGFLLSLSSFSFAQTSSDSVTRQWMGTAASTRSEAAGNLVSSCESTPLVEIGKYEVSGIEDLKFELLKDGEYFAGGMCVFKLIAK